MIKVAVMMVALIGGAFFAQAETTPSDQVKLVTRLYHDFAWEAAAPESHPAGRSLIDSSSGTLGPYFTDELVQFILRDRKQVARTHEIGNLDFCPIWASQDPLATDLTVTQGRKPEIVDVRFICPGDGKKTHLSYRLTLTRRGWRIADIKYDGGYTLREILLGPEAKNISLRKTS